ncbi:unnamed protein product [Trichogramma brassicae]|uniref:Uncharacterized protein n=1 Tax=Trichogramma brassicae TaxID=86971 RepID=A0A6H5IP23_9HYME|nr:unnamed protein product [Trichogramma brassicae]
MGKFADLEASKFIYNLTNRKFFIPVGQYLLRVEERDSSSRRSYVQNLTLDATISGKRVLYTRVNAVLYSSSNGRFTKEPSELLRYVPPFIQLGRLTAEGQTLYKIFGARNGQARTRAHSLIVLSAETATTVSMALLSRAQLCALMSISSCRTNNNSQSLSSNTIAIGAQLSSAHIQSRKKYRRTELRYAAFVRMIWRAQDYMYVKLLRFAARSSGSSISQEDVYVCSRSSSRKRDSSVCERVCYSASETARSEREEDPSFELNGLCKSGAKSNDYIMAAEIRTAWIHAGISYYIHTRARPYIPIYSNVRVAVCGYLDAKKLKKYKNGRKDLASNSSACVRWLSARFSRHILLDVLSPNFSTCFASRSSIIGGHEYAVFHLTRLGSVCNIMTQQNNSSNTALKKHSEPRRARLYIYPIEKASVATPEPLNSSSPMPRSVRLF